MVKTGSHVHIHSSSPVKYNKLRSHFYQRNSFNRNLWYSNHTQPINSSLLTIQQLTHPRSIKPGLYLLGSRQTQWNSRKRFREWKVAIDWLHRVLGSCGFQWCGFHSCGFHSSGFSKNSPNIQLMQFSLHKWRNSFTHAFLVTNDLSAADLVHTDFCQT